MPPLKKKVNGAHGIRDVGREEKSAIPFRGLNRQLLPNSHIFSLAAVESTVVSILPGAHFLSFTRAPLGRFGHNFNLFSYISATSISFKGKEMR